MSLTKVFKSSQPLCPRGIFLMPCLPQAARTSLRKIRRVRSINLLTSRLLQPLRRRLKLQSRLLLKHQPKGKGKGGSNDNLTPRSKAIRKTPSVTAAEKAKTPCIFYAYNSCKAKQCAFLHSDTNKYTDPKPKSLLSPPPPKASAAIAQLIPTMASVASDDFGILPQKDT